jgi:broad specificity phosphatase PhoE
MNIYLIRHGETDWNKSGHIQGRTDNPLNEVGMQQAQELVTRLKDITPDVVVSSSLTRAKQTMNTVYSQLNLQCDKVIDDSFIERNFGEFEGLKGSEYNATTDFSKYKLF